MLTALHKYGPGLMGIGSLIIDSSLLLEVSHKRRAMLSVTQAACPTPTP